MTIYVYYNYFLQEFLIDYIICRQLELHNQSAEQPVLIGQENCAHAQSDNSTKQTHNK